MHRYDPAIIIVRVFCRVKYQTMPCPTPSLSEIRVSMHVITTPSYAYPRRNVTPTKSSVSKALFIKHAQPGHSYCGIVVKEVDIPRPLTVVAHELTIARRSYTILAFQSYSIHPHTSNGTNVLTLSLCVARQHALDTDTHALHVMHRAPSLRVQQVQAYNAVAVDVRVHGNRALRRRAENHLGRFYRV
jgi:hypothetical protein